VTRRARRGRWSIAFAVVAGASLTSCTSVHNSLGTHDSACFRVLPTADHAVGGQGAYRGVRLAPANTLVKDIHTQKQDKPGATVPPALVAAEKVPTCLVEYKGTFTLASLVDGWSPSGATTGTYVVVVVRQRDETLVAAVLLRREPLRFGDFPG
jgi:hypothetical protein